MSWWPRFANVFRKDRVEMPRRFGDPQYPDDSLAANVLVWLDAVLNDARLGIRALSKNALVNGAAIASLALAFGASVAAFSLVDALILRPLPVRSPNELVTLAFPSDRPERPESNTFNDPLFQRLRNAGHGHVDLFAMSTQAMHADVFGAGGAKELARTQYVSGDAFERLGVHARIGRTISVADDAPDVTPVAVLSEGFWQRRFGADPSVIGRWFADDGRQIRIIGVGESGFNGVEPGRPTDVWLPYGAFDRQAFGSAAVNWFRILGRVTAGASPAQVQNSLQGAFTTFRREFVSDIGPSNVEAAARFLAAPLIVRSAATGVSPLRAEFGRSLWVLFTIAALVLVVAGSNVGNLYAARAAAREREMALRLSVGASRGRLIQLLLIESLIVASLASVLGLVIAKLTAPSIVEMLTRAGDPIQLDLGLSGTVFAFAAGVTIVVSVVFGLSPAWRASRVEPMMTLNAGGRPGTKATPLRPFVAIQVAFGLVVLFVGGLLVRSSAKVSHVDPGFTTANVVLVNVEPTRDLRSSEERSAFFEALDRLRTLPGVESAAVAEFYPIGGRAWTREFHPPSDGRTVVVATMSPVSDGYVETMRVRLVAGRALIAADMKSPRTAVVVNEAFAQAQFGSVASALGRPLRGRFDDSDVAATTHMIVGIVGNARYDLHSVPAPVVYFPLRTGGAFHVRVAAGTADLTAGLRESVRQATPLLRVTTVLSLASVVDQTLVRERLLAALSTFFGVVALALIAVGLYGVLSYSVQRRRREIGVRLALGAPGARIVRGVLADMGRPVLIGVVVGLAGGFYFARFVETLLFEISPWSIASVALPLIVFLAVAAVSAVAPAWRATRVEPIVALRYE